jgi:hypothetical protein
MMKLKHYVFTSLFLLIFAVAAFSFFPEVKADFEEIGSSSSNNPSCVDPDGYLGSPNEQSVVK